MPFDPIDAAQKAKFIGFAYNMFTPGVLQPPPDPGIAAAGYRFLYYLNASDFDSKEFYGYIAESTTSPGSYVLAIRGTETLKEWILDIVAIPVLFGPKPSAGFVALGFQSIYSTFQFIDSAGHKSTLKKVIAKLSAAPGGITEFLVLGHSLGAALATLAAAELVMVNPHGVKDSVAIYTFASPRVGLLDFASSFNENVPSSFRIWNILDIVPQVPPFPYIHVSGLGDCIVQTQEQMETLLVTPPCEHHLTSYEWLMDPANFALDANCSQVAAHARVAAMAATVGHTPADHAVGAKAMRKAACGHS